MKNRYTVIQINGLRGLLLILFLAGCAVSGFIFFPAWCCMKIWNALTGYVSGMPLMEIKHGIMLWLIIALSSYASLSNKLKFGMVSKSEFVDNALNPLKNDVKPEAADAPVVNDDLAKKVEK